MTPTSDRTLTALAVLREPTTSTERSVAHRVRAIRYLAKDEHAATIAPVLIAPTRVPAFAAMTEDERLATLVECAFEHRRAERRAQGSVSSSASKKVEAIVFARREAAANAPGAAAAEAEADTPTAAQHFARWSVSCADGCGAMVATSGARPVVRYRDPSHRARPHARRAA